MYYHPVNLYFSFFVSFYSVPGERNKRIPLYLLFSVKKYNKPGPAKSAPYPRLKNSKRTSQCQFTVLENRKSKKYEPSGVPGPASASPWRAKRGTLLKLSTFLSQLKGGPFGEKTNFRKKVS